MARVVVYALVGDEPGAPAYMGYHVAGGAFMGIRFSGDSPEAVREIADKFWAEETARQAKIKGGAKPAAEPVRKAVKPAAPIPQPDASFEDLI